MPIFGTLRAIVLALALPLMPVAGAEPQPTIPRSDDSALVTAFKARDFAGALAILERQRAARPSDPFVRYNLACARAMLGEPDRAVDELLESISLGFVDYHHMQRDPHLAPLRDHPRYGLILRGWRDLLDERGRTDLASARDNLGPAYAPATEDELRINLLSAIDPRSFEDARAQILRVAQWVGRTFPGMGETQPDRSDPWVLVILPTTGDFQGLVGLWGVGGIYDRDRKKLVTQDIGPSLRHEFFHVLHWRHMDRCGQQHPFWIMEGLASLLEDVDQTESGDFVLRPSWRTNIAKRLERAGGLTAWPRLASMNREAFMGGTARANYAQARAIFMYLHEHDQLAAWYADYTARYREDPTGIASLEHVLGKPAKEAERDYRAWLRALPVVAEQSRPAAATLGAELGPGAGDGVEVLALINPPRVQDRSQRLRRRDVITAIDGQEARTLDDLHRLLGDKQVGQTVRLSLRRGSERLDIDWMLVAAPEERDLVP
jgi:hypothetical protein